MIRNYLKESKVQSYMLRARGLDYRGSEPQMLELVIKIIDEGRADVQDAVRGLRVSIWETVGKAECIS